MEKETIKEKIDNMAEKINDKKHDVEEKLKEKEIGRAHV